MSGVNRPHRSNSQPAPDVPETGMPRYVCLFVCRLGCPPVCLTHTRRTHPDGVIPSATPHPGGERWKSSTRTAGFLDLDRTARRRRPLAPRSDSSIKEVSMFHSQRIRHVFALPRQHVVEVGIIIALALGAGGTLAINGGLFAPASQEAAPRVITGPVVNNPAASSIDGGRQPVTAPLTAQEARAQDLQQQAMTMMNEGNYGRAQELTQQREAVLHGEQSASVESPALTEQQARAQELQQQGTLMLADGNWQQAQQYYKQSQAALQGDHPASGASPALTEQQARAQALRKQGDDYLRTGDYQHAQQYYMQSDALLQGE